MPRDRAVPQRLKTRPCHKGCEKGRELIMTQSTKAAVTELAFKFHISSVKPRRPTPSLRS